MSLNAKIIVATHKAYQMPTDSMYVPVQVGAEGKASLGYAMDNVGDNISAKNKNYCELTGLYWAWKNMDAEYIGLAHYRRHFSIKPSRDKWSSILTTAELETLVQGFDVILPKPRNYFIESNYSQYVHAHHAIDLDTTREIISEKYPGYLKAYDAYMKRTIGHRFNMFIMKKFGFVSERLIDVWLETNSVKYKEIPCMFMEKQNWLVKGFNFLKRKFGGSLCKQ